MISYPHGLSTPSVTSGVPRPSLPVESPGNAIRHSVSYIVRDLLSGGKPESLVGNLSRLLQRELPDDVLHRSDEGSVHGKLVEPQTDQDHHQHGVGRHLATHAHRDPRLVRGVDHETDGAEHRRMERLPPR